MVLILLNILRPVLGPSILSIVEKMCILLMRFYTHTHTLTLYTRQIWNLRSAGGCLLVISYPVVLQLSVPGHI